MRWEDTVTIEAPAEVVWDLTLDIASWPGITPTMTSVERLDEGPMHVGSSARVKQPRQTAAVWTVTRLEPGRGFTWQTRRMGMTMTGSHMVEPVGDHCRNTLSIDVEGRGSVLFGRMFGRMVATAIATENAGFRAKAESLS
jgi:uncharacterized membrane protein